MLYCFGADLWHIAGQSPVWQRSFASRRELILPLECIVQQDLYPAATVKEAVLGSCTSTFDSIAMFIEKQGFTTWDWVMACRQTRGRGQYGRQWQSPLGNLYVSQILPASFCQTILPMLIASVIVQILKTRGVYVYLKWPNDIILLGPDSAQKVGGLLLEQRLDSLVLGLGLNFTAVLSLDEANKILPVLPPGILPAPDDLIIFWQDCSKQLQTSWWRWRQNTKCELLREIESVMAFLGSWVEFFELDNSGQICRIAGLVRGLGPKGELLLETAEGRQSKISGSLRPIF